MPMALPGCDPGDADAPPLRGNTPPGSLAVHGPRDPGRAEVEAFIAGVFAERFGAQLDRFAPTLVSLRNGGRLVAAAAWRSAGEGPLFLERYLPQPVEALLGPAAGRVPSRSRIVEVGSLAARQPGQGRRLILLLGPYLAALGFQWVVGTLTEELRRLFLRIGVAPLSLGAADPAALGEESARWGRYYEHRPVVLAGHLPLALRQLQQFQRATGTAA
ncbi:thermostable hemolysin [Ramlibacter sp.]|uniref:thermostable hemolysin n=1 Tax=Ramlibacter sp. TaxID=1917967 RepID=UPI002FC95CBC